MSSPHRRRSPGRSRRTQRDAAPAAGVVALGDRGVDVAQRVGRGDDQRLARAEDLGERSRRRARLARSAQHAVLGAHRLGLLPLAIRLVGAAGDRELGGAGRRRRDPSARRRRSPRSASRRGPEPPARGVEVAARRPASRRAPVRPAADGGRSFLRQETGRSSGSCAQPDRSDRRKPDREREDEREHSGRDAGQHARPRRAAPAVRTRRRHHPAVQPRPATASSRL
jgi:hypothetical protein